MKHLLGETSPEEAAAVNKWKAEDEANAVYYNQFNKIWNSSKELATASTVDENKAWQNFQQRITRPKEEVPVVPIKRFSWMRVAASGIVLAGLAIAAFLLLNNNAAPAEMVAQTQQNILIDTLPDNSIVTLNKQSSITYLSKFNGDKREIALKGEAFFNVTPDKKKPFVITVNDVQVTVVGTSFNVKNEKGNTEVVVETGVVRVTKNGKTTELVAGQKLLLTANDSIATKEEVTDKLYNYYRSKEFVCDDTPLWKLVQVLNEVYNSNIVVGREELNNLPLNTTFNNESLDKILEVIHLTFGINVVKRDGQIILQ